MRRPPPGPRPPPMTTVKRAMVQAPRSATVSIGPAIGSLARASKNSCSARWMRPGRKRSICSTGCAGYTRLATGSARLGFRCRVVKPRKGSGLPPSTGWSRALPRAPTDNLLKLYDYPPEVRQAVGNELGRGPSSALLPALVLGGRSRIGKRDDLLSAFEPNSGIPILRLQMALPTPAEARVAFAQYRKMAADAEGDHNLGPLFTELGQLSPDAQNAWAHYLTGDDLVTRYKLLQELASLAGSIQGVYKPLGDVPYLSGRLPALFTPNPSSAAPVAAGPATVVPAASASGPNGATEPSNLAPPVVASKSDTASKDLVEPSKAGKQLAEAIQTYFAQQRGLSQARLDEYRDTFAKLLQADATQASVMDLLTPESLTFAGKLAYAHLPEEQLKAFLAISADPVTPAVERMAQRITFTGETKGVDPRAALLANLKAFSGLKSPQSQQEALLDLLAHDLYQQPLQDLLPLAMAN